MRGVPAAVLVAAITLGLGSLVPQAQAQAAPARALAPDQSSPDRPYVGAQLTWQPSWGHVGTRDYVLFGASLSLVVGKYAIGPVFGKRRGGMFFDEDVRDALRQDALRDERRARDISDVLLTSAVSYPFFDSIVIAGWYRNSPEAARNMAWINAEAMALTAGIQGIANIVAGRERPFGRRCGSGKSEDGRDCDSNDRYYSFFSGHTSQAFVAAGLVCVHHAYLPLYGGGFYDGGICALGMLAAGTTGALRIAGDQHYFTDVAVGALVGTLTGVGLPWLLFYRHGPDADHRGSEGDDDLTLQLVPTANGFRLMGTFR